VLELPLRVVEADGPRAALRERDRPLRRPAAELERVPALDVAEDAQVALRDLPDAPARLPAADELAVAVLVGVARRVPVGAVELGVPGDPLGRRQPPM
jgi:hypothetical protein